MPGRPPPGRGGVGGVFDDDYSASGYKDYGQGEKRAQNLVFDPTKNPFRVSPEQEAMLDAFMHRLNQELQRTLIYAKRPAFVEPPFFAKPVIKSVCGLLVAGGAIASIFDRVIEDRQRAVVSFFGVDVSPIIPLLNCELEFWFSLDADVVPIFDDQSQAPYTVVGTGRTTVLPGSVENPFCMAACGTPIHIKGKKRLTFNVENMGTTSVTIRAVMGYWQYWLPFGATEFEAAEVQL